MTTTEQLPWLVRAVYSDRQWPAGKVSPNGFPVSVYGTVFNPYDNADQALDVQVWLLAQDDDAEVNFCQVVFHNKIKRAGYSLEPHDGTAAGLRAAVLAAALRVV